MGTLSVRPVVTLHDDAARDPELAGAKAASLAKAAAAGLPVLPGVVLTTAGVRAYDKDAMRHGWDNVSQRGTRPVVVRSSSTAEDGVVTSMAGLFTSVLDVRDWRGFRAAVDEVVASGGEADMAVLVQPFLEPHSGGVLFGADPISGRRDRMVVDAVNGGPHRLVQGQVSGDRWTLTPHGRVVEHIHIHGSEVVAFGPAHRWALTGMARRAAALLGGPQDIEWAFDRAGKLWLLQSRPITTLPAGAVEGPVYGPGPVAETFPDALWPLEEDLWLDPLRVALREALSITGTSSKRVLKRRPLVLSIGGRVAVDLGVLGMVPPKHRLLAKLDFRPPARRVTAAWRVGRLRSALPLLAQDMLDRVDGDMSMVPALRELSVDQLLSVLERSRQALVAVHGHEVLMGLLVDTGTDTMSTTAAAVALRQLAAGRAAGLDDDRLVARHPLTLVLRPPTVGPPAPFPDPPQGLPAMEITNGPAVTREALRARARLLQELGARAARELGRRLQVDPRSLRLDQLAAVATGAPMPEQDRVPAVASELPVAFRLTTDGHVVPLPRRGADGTGVGAGGGRGVGTVHVGDDPPAGSVLVVRHLEPSLAGVLPRLAGIVAETGSVLSHLAILAREMHVPVVVAVPDALVRFTAGSTVTVDGTTGEVELS